MLRRRVACLVIALAAVAGSGRASETVLTSTSPYWLVGERDDDLSAACSLNQFGPLHPGALLARFTGPQGGALLDVALGTGLNLRDPRHLAVRDEDYFFRNVGTTSCEVLVGGRNKGARVARPGAR